MKAINIKDIKILNIYFANNEMITFGEYSIDKFLFEENNVILDLKLGEDIKYKPLQYENPLDRIHCRKDIIEISCLLKNNDTIEIKPKWEDEESPYIMSDENGYQTSTRENLSKIHIEISSKEILNKNKILLLTQINEDGLYRDIQTNEILVINKGNFDNMTIDMIKHTFEKIA